MDFDKKYKIGKKLSSGSFGQVHLITDRKTKKKYVVKLMTYQNLENKYSSLPHYSEDSLYYIKKEFGMLKKISKIPYVIKYIKYYDEVLYKGVSYIGIVTEYITGNDLGKYIKSSIQANKVMNEKALLKFMLKMFYTLKVLHSKKIVHRDIKPANIMFNSKNIKLIDFGLACLVKVGTTSDKKLKCEKFEMGTRQYYSPELLKGVLRKKNIHLNILEKADIWALGLICYELANLNYPFSELDELLTKQKFKSHHSNTFINKVIESILTYDYNKRPSANTIHKMLLKYSESLSLKRSPKRSPTKIRKSPKKEIIKEVESPKLKSSFKKKSPKRKKSPKKNVRFHISDKDIKILWDIMEDNQKSNYKSYRDYKTIMRKF
jgi:serine/threonine protein kinase